VTREWLETDGLGGFASGPVSGPRTRRYHGLLVAATRPPTGRMMLVSGMDVTVQTPGGQWVLAAQRYAPDVVTGDGERFAVGFTHDPWPTWVYRLPDGTELAQELFMRAGTPQTFVTWRLRTRSPARLSVRPFLAGRDFHALMHENPVLSFEPRRVASQAGPFLRFQPYAGGPTLAVASNGTYEHQPHWYRNFVYDEERRRGLDFTEDLAAPGTWTFDLSTGEAVLAFAAERAEQDPAIVPARAALEAARISERARRAALGAPLERAADQYVVARGAGRTIIAGYPWFGDWGRDTFIAMRGLCLATGRVGVAFDILSAWAGLVSDGMLPNFFPDGSGQPEYNSVDASLWYVVTAAEALRAAERAPLSSRAAERQRVVDACDAILAGYARGTRHGIRATADGLLAAGVRGQQLTWMDARVDGREITPRIGKPVEVQALWWNALSAAATFGTPASARWRDLATRAHASFEARFWDDAHDRLYDVVDVDHQPDMVDATLRPNQIFALGGLPLPLLTGVRAQQVLATVEAALLTPMGLRSLAPSEPGYCPRYQGGVAARDGAYHQGTVWPWLLGPFVEAFVRVHGDTRDAKLTARRRFLNPLLARLGPGHLPEVADGDSPYTPGGCPFQAWSVGEALRLDRLVLADG
jgi:predicted glycogen debranching enzyme